MLISFLSVLAVILNSQFAIPDTCRPIEKSFVSCRETRGIITLVFQYLLEDRRVIIVKALTKGRCDLPADLEDPSPMNLGDLHICYINHKNVLSMKKNRLKVDTDIAHMFQLLSLVVILYECIVVFLLRPFLKRSRAPSYIHEILLDSIPKY